VRPEARERAIVVEEEQEGKTKSRHGEEKVEEDV